LAESLVFLPHNRRRDLQKLGRKLYRDKTISLDEICTTLKMSKSTLYRYIAMRPEEEGDGQRRAG
jgi:hypothetical protein